MSIQTLFDFETQYPFLYEERVGGVPVYTCLRDGVVAILNGNGQETVDGALSSAKGRVFIRRILDFFVKRRRYKKAETLIFTSAVYRRDRGRNLAAEYLMERYPNAVTFEWPSRNEDFDRGYFADKGNYVPLDGHLIKYKLYTLFHRKEMKKIAQECRERLQGEFAKNPPKTELYRKAVHFILDTLPDCVANTTINQRLFAKLFKKFKNVKYAVDFWGAARENIIPVLQGEPQPVELQHGIIMPYHAGYVYPQFVKDSSSNFFQRKLLVYGERTKKLLTEQSIFSEEQIEVIGNPRIQRYKAVAQLPSSSRKTIVFASQSYEQDGTGRNYYQSVIDLLKLVQKQMQEDEFWSDYQLAVKLHPRESDGAKQLYLANLPGIQVYGNTSQLFEILNSAFVQLTVSSTTLYEGAQFDTPTVAVKYAHYQPSEIYGFDTWWMKDEQSVVEIMQRLKDKEQYAGYLSYLKTKTKEYM